MDINSTFVKGRMNKSVDERLIPPGEYVDALNVRLGSTESTEIGAVENSKGNTKLTTLQINGTDISSEATCIGSYADGINETLYWFVHDPNFLPSPTGIADLVVSFNTSINAITYHLVSFDVLKFDPKFLITGVNKIEDLLFFTDDLNPPRVVNVKRDYGPNNTFTEEQISVIVKPPGFRDNELGAPEINLFNTNSIENTFIEEVFISFAYRFKYLDNKYSATSLFTTAAFDPGNFQLNYSTFENEGMLNQFNSINVKVSTGNADVVGLEILYKASNSTSIYLVEKLNKSLLGIPNDTSYNYPISAQKIYTLLGQDELLRQYDNVPLIAKSQTIQGNRLIYGNYEDGRDITTVNGTPIPVNFVSQPKSVDIQGTILKTPQQTSNSTITTYNIAGAPQAFTQNDVIFSFLLESGDNPWSQSGNIIPAGTVFTTTYSFNARFLNGDVSDPDFPTGFLPFGGASFDININFTTGVAYSSIAALMAGPEFQNSIGLTNFLPISQSGNGSSLTDRFNALMINQAPSIAQGYADNFTFDLSGITSPAVSESMAIQTINSPTSQGYVLTPIACRFTSTTGVQAFAYFKGVATTSVISTGSTTNNNSLHSNRDYDVAIVYMDEYGRATPAISSVNSATHFPAERSISKNTIQVDINSEPPVWATRYKFVLKPNFTNYNIIYVTRFYTDRLNPNIYWLKLEGDDQNLVSAGQRLICKADSNGPLNDLAVETVIDVKSYGGGELGPDPGSGSSDSLAGLYFSINPDKITLRASPNSTIHYLRVADKSITKTSPCGTGIVADPNRTVSYPVYNAQTSDPQYYDLPAGSIIRFKFQIWRSGYGGIGAGDRGKSVNWKWEQEFTTDQAWPSFYDWWEGNNIGNLVGGTSSTGEQGLVGSYDDTSYTTIGSIPAPCLNEYTFTWTSQTSTTTPFPVLDNANLVLVHGVPRGGPSVDMRPSNVNVRIFVNRQNDLQVFETEPDTADPNLFYDSSEMYKTGFDINGDKIHLGNVQDQVLQSLIPAIVELPFYNCYAFGNGVESYQILDLAVEKRLNLGERTTAQTNTEIKRADRFSGLTYSGIYSGPNNVNNLNEFNLGLINYKDLEISFGPIMKLHSRETDILVLQEDRISYVLTNKDLISDAVGGGAIVSSPTVLGKQVARIEEYGISFNPESFTSWGKDVYFTDTKRSSILKLGGGGIKSDELEVVSDYGMRSFFRDQFETQLTTQKIGGYDPYMDEYVLSSNNNPVPVQDDIIPCGNTVSVADTLVEFERSFDLGPVRNNTTVSWSLNSTGSKIDIEGTWNGISVISETDRITSGTVTFLKNFSYPTTFNLKITPKEKSSFTFTVNCPVRVNSSVVRIVLSSSENASKTIHNQFQWIQPGTINGPTYYSPLDIDQVILQNTSATQGCTFLDNKTGVQSLEMIPYTGVKLNLGSREFSSDDMSFNPNLNKFYMFVQNNNLATPGDWDLTLLQGQSKTTPVLNPQTGLFTAEESLGGYIANQVLVLVTDLRTPTRAAFAYSNISESDACAFTGMPCNVFSTNSVPVQSRSAACALDPTNLPSGQTMVNRGHAGPNPGSARVGDPCYQTASCGNGPADMLPGFYRLSGSTARVIEIGSGAYAGICINKFNC